jgi:hypothetical protein
MTMKKLIAIMLTVGLFAAIPGSASAEMRGGYSGHGGYSGRGGYYGHGGYYGGGYYGPWGFFAGLVGGAILGTAISHSYEPVYAPAPRVYYAPPPEQVWVPGRYETRNVRRWVPGYWATDRNPRNGETEDDGYSRARRVWVPGHYQEVPSRVWLPGHWEEPG